MKVALKKDKVRDIYNKTAGYYNIFHNLGTIGLDEKGRNILINRCIKKMIMFSMQVGYRNHSNKSM